MKLMLKIETLPAAILISTIAMSASAQTLGGLQTQIGEISQAASGGNLATARAAISLLFEGGVPDAPPVQVSPTHDPRPAGKWLRLRHSEPLKPRFQATAGGGGIEPGQDKGDNAGGAGGEPIGGLPDIMEPAKPKK